MGSLSAVCALNQTTNVELGVGRYPIIADYWLWPLISTLIVTLPLLMLTLGPKIP